MYPTKQAKSQSNSGSGKEPKLHQVTEWRKTLGETISRVPVLLWPTKEQCMIRAALQVRLDQNI